jgi:ribosomal-protein-alanine N-acetyltransferase
MTAESQRQESPLRVAACRTEDLAQIQDILKTSPEAAAWSRTSVAEIFESAPAYFLLGWQSEEIAGFIAGRRVQGEAEILNLAVKPHFRRRGIGKALVLELLQVLERDSVLRVFLEVRESNAPAIAFYQRFGFEVVGRRIAYYREPDEGALLLALHRGQCSRPGTR